MMEYHVEYYPAALDDILSIYAYIAFDLMAEQAATNQVNRIWEAIRKLSVFPEKHERVTWEPWASMNMRFLPIDHYIAYYIVSDERRMVSVVRVFYGGRDIRKIVRDGIE